MSSIGIGTYLGDTTDEDDASYTSAIQHAVGSGINVIDTALNMQANTCSFDVSGHPAFTVPCGRVNGLPVGLMLVGRHFEETTLIRLARAIEAAGDWKLN